MKFSLFYEMQISDPTRASEARIFHESLAQAELAEELGYHCIWAVEHHGLYEYSHSSAPEIFLSFVAARTRRIRIGHGVNLLPYRYNHPIRCAERVATLDILSEGRVNWGTGKSASQVEQHAFESDIPSLHAQWAEALEIIPRMWQEDVFSYEGRFFRIPPTQVLPRPVQHPHPPIFAACSKPDSAKDVGALGLGALNFAVGDDVFLEQKVQEYRKAIASAAPKYRAKNESFGCAPPCLVLPDDREACRYGLRGARFFTEALGAYYYGRPTGKLGIPRDFLPEQELNEIMAYRNAPGSHMTAIVGDPVAVRETVARFQKAGVDELMLIMQLGTVPHELIMKSIRTFGEKVLPHFA